MNYITIIESIIGVIVATGACIAGLGYAYGKFTEGRESGSIERVRKENEMIQLRKSQIDELRDLVNTLTKKIEEQAKTHNDEMRALHSQLGEVRGQLQEKEKQNKDYLEILQNRSPLPPELEKILFEIRDLMQSINEHMQRGEKDLKIEATVSKQ